MSSDPAYLGAEIAVVGMALRAPGARTPDQFWRLLCNGEEMLRRYSEDELRESGVPESLIRDPNYVPAGAPLDPIDRFDADFFGFNAEDAAMTDPQHRHFLECAWEALEHAGHPPSRFPGAVGVFAGCGMNSYFIFNLVANPELLASRGLFQLRHTGNDHDFLPTSVSYRLNLRGPSLAVQTACSSSLVAVHLGVQSLLSGECDMALVGGVHILVPHRHGYLYRPSETLSPDGRCFAFDSRASGTVISSGAAVLALRRLEDALRDADHIHAVIRGTAVNNDGAGKAGFFAPGIDGHARAITEAQTVAGLGADDITYMEVPGMGTPIGDPLMIAALTKAFRRTTQRSGFCRICSTEPNVGHMDIASGAAALIKAVMAVEHRQVPPSLNFDRPNPAIDFPSTPFIVNTRLVDWETDGRPRRAGVSAVGIGGTNAHVIVEQPPAPALTDPADRVELLILSAKSPAALDAITSELADHLEGDPALNLGDVAFTLREGRETFDFRRAFAVTSVQDAVQRLRGRGPVSSTHAAAPKPGVVFAFPASLLNADAAASLAAAFPIVRHALEHAAPHAREILGADLLGPLAAGHRPTHADDRSSAVIHVAAQIAVAGLFQSWGVRPAGVVGNGHGEHAATHLAGIIPLPAALARAAGASAVTPHASPASAPAPPLFASIAEARADDRIVLYLSPPHEWPDLDRSAPVIAAGGAADPMAQALDALGRLWTSGAAVDWASFRQGRRRRRIPLPTYPFQRNRFWIDPPKTPSHHQDPEPTESGRAHFSKALWEKRPWPAATETPSRSRRPWLVFLDTAGLGTQLAARLRARGERVITVREGDAFYRFSPDEYALMPEGGRDAYQSLIADLASQDSLPGRILHLWLVTADTSFRPGSSFLHRNQEQGFFSLFFLARTLAAHDAMKDLRIDVVTTGLHAIGEQPVLHPEKATALGPIRVLPREFPDIVTACFDVELPPLLHRGRGRAKLELLISRLLTDLDRPTPGPPVAYRADTRYEQTVQNVPPPAPPRPPGPPGLPRPSPWRNGGVYLITGGLGGIGLIVAEHLARSARARLVLLSRTPLPPRADWDAWLDSHAARDKVSLVLRRLLAIEKAGAEVLPVAGDVANIESLSAAIDAARSRFGEINAVLHLAGSIDEELIIDKSPETVDRVFTPKVYGTFLLAEQLRGAGLDLFLMFSSTSSVVGPPGQSDYAGANAFLDAFALSNASAGLGKVVSINWGSWRDVGMSAGFTRREVHDATEPANPADPGLVPPAALDALDQAAAAPGSGLIISAADIPEILGRLATRRPAPVRVRPTHASENGVPRDELEHRLAELWRQTIGAERVGVHDDFFDLGGHSLNAVRIFAELRREFHVTFPLSTLFEAPTVAQLAQMIRAETGHEPSRAAPARPRSVRSFKYLVAANNVDQPDTPPLFLAAGMFGNVLNLRHIAAHLRAQPVYAIQARGLLGDDEPHTSFEEMARDYLAEIRQVQPHGPYLLGGFSGGGLAMFEAAHQLLADGEHVAALIMLDAYGPRLPTLNWPDRLKLQWWRLRTQGFRYVATWAKNRAAWEFAKIRRLLETPIEPLTPAEFRSRIVQQGFAEALAKYQPRVYPGPIFVFRPHTEAAVRSGPGRVLSVNRTYIDHQNFWGPFTAAGVEVHVMPGNHDAMVLEPQVRVLAERLTRVIAASLANSAEASAAEAPHDVAAT